MSFMNVRYSALFSGVKNWLQVKNPVQILDTVGKVSLCWMWKFGSCYVLLRKCYVFYCSSLPQDFGLHLKPQNSLVCSSRKTYLFPSTLSLLCTTQALFGTFNTVPTRCTLYDYHTKCLSFCCQTKHQWLYRRKVWGEVNTWHCTGICFHVWYNVTSFESNSYIYLQ